MAPKRKEAAVAAAPAPKRASRSRSTAVVKVEAPPAKAAKATKAKAEPKAAAKGAKVKVEEKEAAAKGKVAKAAPKAAAKKGKSKGPDQEEFAHKLLEVCKVLIATVTIVVDEDADSGTITTEEDYMTYGNDLLQLLPEDARLPMMKMAHLYREEVEDELDTLDWIELSDSDDEEDEDEEDLPPPEDDIDEEDDESDFDDDFMLPEHFYHFKQYFTPEAAATFMKKVDKATEEAISNMCEDLEDAEAEAEAVQAVDDEEEQEYDITDVDVPWKGE